MDSVCMTTEHWSWAVRSCAVSIWAEGIPDPRNSLSSSVCVASASTSFADKLHNIYNACQHLSSCGLALCEATSEVPWEGPGSCFPRIWRNMPQQRNLGVGGPSHALQLSGVCVWGWTCQWWKRLSFSGISKSQTKGTEEGFFVLTVWLGHFLFVSSLQKKALCCTALSAFCWGWKQNKMSYVLAFLLCYHALGYISSLPWLSLSSWLARSPSACLPVYARTRVPIGGGLLCAARGRQLETWVLD